MASVGWSVWLTQAVKQQLALVCELWLDSRFWGPMTSLWVSDFGSSVSTPVSTYLYLILGLTPENIGTLGLAQRFGTIVFAPLYGSSVDKFGITGPLTLSITACGIGCSLKGFANNLTVLLMAVAFIGAGGGCTWTMTKGYVAGNIDESNRALLITGFQMQMMILSSTSILYPAFDSLMQFVLNTDDKLLRYRSVIIFCGFTCWIGIAVLVYWAWKERKNKGKGVVLPAKAVAKKSDPSESEPPAKTYRAVQFAMAAVALWMIDCCNTMLTMLWPLYIKQHFGWDARAFAYLTFAYTLILAIGLILYPRAIQGRITQQHFLKILVVATACMLPGFVMRSAALHSVTIVFHIVTSVLCLSLVGTLESGAETLASLCMADNVQGGVMGGLNTMKALGAVFGFLFGPRMWTWSLARSEECSVTAITECALAGGNLPFFVTFALLAVALALYSFGELAPAQNTSVEAKFQDEPESPIKGVSRILSGTLMEPLTAK